MKILGIDYGDKRIGLALAESNSIAVPYMVLENNHRLIDQLKDVVAKENIDLIVVGLPYSLSGKINERLTLTKEFIAKISQNIAIPVETVNEQFTSKIYTKLGVKKDLDKHAATAILETWLQKKHD